MARKSNDELIAEIETLAKGLDLEVDPKLGELDNGELYRHLRELEALAEKPDAPEPPKPQEVSKALDPKLSPKVEAKEEKVPDFTVTEGNALTSKKGILDSGDEVKAEYLVSGKAGLEALIERGFITDNRKK